MKSTKDTKGILWAVRLFGIALCLMLTLMPIQSAKALSWKATKMNTNRWVNGLQSLWIADNNLFYSNATVKNKKLASWKLDENTSLRILTIYKNKAYIVKNENGGKGDLYSTDLKSGKTRKAASKCCPAYSQGAYLYGGAVLPSDVSSFQQSVWKITGNKVKKICSLGKKVFATIPVNKNLVYGVYTGKGDRNLTAYMSKLNGSGRKKLFSLKSTDTYGQVIITAADSKKVSVTMTGTTTKQYEYSLKTKKLVQVK